MESETVTEHRSGGHLSVVDAGDASDAGGATAEDPDRLDRRNAMAQLEARRAALDERIGVLSAQIHALSAELVDTIAEYDHAQGWQGGGFVSMSHWLSVRTKFTSAEGRRLASLVERRHDIPTLMGHARAGRMSLGVMAAAARVTTEQNEARVAEIAMACTPSQASRVLAKYRSLTPSPRPDDPASDPAGDDDGTPAPEPSSWWHCWYDEQGRGRIDAALEGDIAALVEQAWAAATAAGERDRSRNPHLGTPNDERCDGLRRLSANEVAERFASTMLDHAADQGLRAPGGDRYGVVVNIDVETLARVLGLDWDSSLPIRLGSECFDSRTGRHLADHEVARILCDANISVLVHHQGVPLWMSNETRTANRHQRRALQFRSGGKGGCEFPGCTQTRYLDAHHVIFHSADGRTDPSNMVLLCGHHHRALHRGEYSLTTHGDQRFTFTDRHGSHLGCTNTAHSPGGPPPGLQHLPGLDRPPDPPPWLSGDTPRSTTHGERLTAYALDTYLHHLLAA